MAKTFQFDYPTPELVKEYVDKFDNDKSMLISLIMTTIVRISLRIVQLSSCLISFQTTQSSTKY